MTTHLRRAAVLFMLAGVWSGAWAAPGAGGDAARGQTLYQSLCVACHSIDYNGVGPAHKGVFGRRAGSQPDYSYSAALKASAIVWNAATLEQWLRDPEKLVPGQKMGFTVPGAQDRADLIAYLQKQTLEKTKTSP